MALTLNNLIGFETGGLEEAVSVAATPTAQEVVVRTGDYSLLCNPADEYNIRVIEGGSADGGNKYIVGFAAQFTDKTPAGDVYLFRAYDSVGEVFALILESDSDVRVRDAELNTIGTITDPLTEDQWHFIEIAWEHDAAGSIDIHIDGVSKFSENNQDLTDGGSMDDDAATYRLGGAGLPDTYFDDAYCYSGATDTGDFLGDAEIFRYQANTASVTPDSGDDFDEGDSPYYWQQLGRTPSDASAAGYSDDPMTGYVFTDDAEDGKHYRHGPHGDANIDGTIKGAKWIWVLDSEGAADHHVIYGNDSPSVTADLQSMVTAYTTYFRVKDAAADECPTVAEHFAIGFGTVGNKGLLGKEMWAMLLHVPTGGVTHEGAAAVAGAGTLSVLGRVIRKAVLALAGAGALTVAAVATVVASASPAGAGTLTATAQCYVPGESSVAGEGTLAANAIVTRAGAANLAGEGTLTPAAVADLVGASNLSGEGTLQAAAVSTLIGTAPLSGKGTLTINAIVTKAGATSLAGEGTLTVVGYVGELHEGASSVAGEGTLSVDAVCIRAGIASLSGEGVLTTAAVADLVGTSSLSGEGTLQAAAVCTRVAIIDLSGEGTLAVAGTVGELHEGAASLAGEGTLGVSLVGTLVGAADLSGEGTLQVTGTRTLVGVAPLSAMGILEASGTISGIKEGTAALAGEGTLGAAGVRTLIGIAPLAAEGTLTIIGTTAIVHEAAASLSGNGTLTVAGVLTAIGIASLEGEGILAVAIISLRAGEAALSGTGTLTVTAFRTGEVTLSGTGTLTVTCFGITTRLITLLGSIDTLKELTGSIDTLKELAGSIDTLKELTGSIDTLKELAGSIDTLKEMEGDLIMPTTQNTDWICGEAVTIWIIIAGEGSIAGYHFNAAISPGYGSIAVITKVSGDGLSIYDADTRVIQIDIAQDDSEDLAAGTYVWDVWRTDADYEACLTRGEIELGSAV